MDDQGIAPNQSTPPPGQQPVYLPPPPPSPTPQQEQNTAPQPTPPVSSPQPTAQQPQAPAPQQQTEKPHSPQPPPRKQLSIKPKFIIIVAVVIIAAVVIALLYSKGMLSFASTSTTSATTTVISGNFSSLTGCTTISKSGKYYINYGIKTSIASGACINVTSSNVSIICNNNKVVGSGPFSGVPPFTYGILINGQSNVSVIGCAVKNFSYGIFAASSNGLVIRNNNISINYMSNIHLSNVHYSNISNNYISKSASEEGSIYLTNGTADTGLYNNTILYNQFYGISVNSSGNLFQNNLINGTQYSLICSPSNGYVISSSAHLNTCFNSTGCGFLQCRGINIPPNISKIALGSVISSCGSIRSGGSYQLSGSINMRDYLNTSNPLSLLIPCIDVMANNVNINCNGFNVTNSTTAFYIQNRNNITLSNCRISNSKIQGIIIQNSSQTHVSNTTLFNDSYGVVLYNSSIDSLLNVTAFRNLYGIYLSGSYSNNFQNSNFSLNNYGAYLQSGSISNNFNNDVLLNNSKMDVYAAPDSANATLSLMQSTVCGYTNAVWANCKHFVYTSLPYVPIDSCGTIGSPGNYLLTSSILNAKQGCMKIASSNVRFSCNGRSIISSESTGDGIAVKNLRNVSISSCFVGKFDTDINASNSTLVSLTNLQFQGGSIAVSFNGISNGLISHAMFNGTQNVSIYLYNTISTRVLNNSMTYGLSRSIAILINNSVNNMVLNNTGTSSDVGLQLSGRSANNTVINNTMNSDVFADYLCIGNGGLSSENGGINYGTTKIGCKWLAALTKISPSVECIISRLPNIITFTQDEEYIFGSTCFSIYENSTTIDCMGHTIIATNGGTFASFANSTNSKIRNCVLKGFTTPITSYNSSGMAIQNNTVLVGASSTGIKLHGSRIGSSILLNNVSASNVGINITNASSGIVQSNYVSNAAVAYVFSNVSSYSIVNNTADASTTGGLLLLNSIENQFQGNKFVSSAIAMQCTGISRASANNTDFGSNYCTNQFNCKWLSSPACH